MHLNNCSNDNGSYCDEMSKNEMLSSIRIHPHGSFSNFLDYFDYPRICLLVQTWDSIRDHHGDSSICDDDCSANVAHIFRILLQLWDYWRVGFKRLQLCNDLLWEAEELQTGARTVCVLQRTWSQFVAVASV